MFGNLFGRVKNLVGNMYGGAKKLVGNVYEGAKNVISSGIDMLPDAINKAREIYNVGSGMYNQNKDLINSGVNIARRFFQKQ